MARPKAASPKKGGKRQQKKLKDPNAPKKPTTAFFFFVKHRRERKEDEGKKVAEFTKECGALWQEMGTEQRAKFDKQAQADRDRYQKQMASYKPSGKFAAAAADPNEPPRPKKATTAFVYFANAKRPELVKEGLKATEVLQEAGRLWKDMDDDEKDPYQRMADKDKKRYSEEKARYDEELKSYRKNGAKKPAKQESEDDDDDDDDDDEEDSDDE